MKKLSEAATLPYETIFVVDMYYSITANIDLSNKLDNGTVSKLCCYVDRNEEGNSKMIWNSYFLLKKLEENVGITEKVICKKKRHKSTSHAYFNTNSNNTSQ